MEMSFLLSNSQGQHAAGAGRAPKPEFIILDGPTPPLDGTDAASRWSMPTPGSIVEQMATSCTQNLH
jgi:hypothetical protein